MRRFADRFSGRVVQSVGGCVCACACVFVLTMTLERIDFRRLFFVFFPDPLKNKLWLFALWLEFLGYFLSFAICLI